ncbi:MAG: NAD(P)/FAD-dependent oxidoreductase [Betaproteobacteria bacterium]
MSRDRSPGAESSNASCDIAVIGAGPAGLAAAAAAASFGLDVALIDEQPLPGGQIYRAIAAASTRRDLPGADTSRGERLVDAMQRSSARWLPATTVWSIVADGDAFELGLSHAGQSRILRARQVIVATGAQERPFPIPGWTLPGVMTAGAAQILLKSNGLVPDVPTVLAGTGPLLYLLAAQYVASGARIDYLLDTTSPARRQPVGTMLDFVRSPYLAKGWAVLRAARKSTRFITGVTHLKASGNGKLEHIAYTRNGRDAVIPAGLLLLHQGVIPALNLSSASGCAQHWDAQQCCFVPTLDAWGASSIAGITIAGDAAGIAGARAAEARGILAAHTAASALGRIHSTERDASVSHSLREIERWTRGRRFIDMRFTPPEQFRIPSGDTIVCRCEEVTAQQVIDTVKLGCTGPNQMKAFLRCGMGPCQGRLCGLTITELIAQQRGVTPADTGYYRLRFPVKPITLGELASMPRDDAARDAVVRVGANRIEQE